MQKGRRKLNQAGMTLVELIVVILILGILSAGTAVGINYASRMNSTSAAEKLVSLMERTRIYTISAEETSTDASANKVSLVLTKEGNTYYGKLMYGSTEVDKVALGNTSLTIKVTETVLNGEGAEVDNTHTISDASGGSYTISYKKANGAFKEKYKQIEISGSKTRYIQMVHTTGRAYLK